MTAFNWVYSMVCITLFQRPVNRVVSLCFNGDNHNCRFCIILFQRVLFFNSMYVQ